MLVSSFYASRLRDATRRMRVTELLCAAPSQQRLRRSSDSVAAAAPSQQQLRRSSTTIYNLAHNWSSHRHVPPRGAANSTSRRDAAAPRGGTRAARSISSVAASSAPSQQQKQATAVSRDDERSTGLLCGNDFATHRQTSCFIQNFSPERA